MKESNADQDTYDEMIMKKLKSESAQDYAAILKYSEVMNIPLSDAIAEYIQHCTVNSQQLFIEEIIDKTAYAELMIRTLTQDEIRYYRDQKAKIEAITYLLNVDLPTAAAMYHHADLCDYLNDLLADETHDINFHLSAISEKLDRLK